MWEVALYYLAWTSASSLPVKSALWYVSLSVLLTFSSCSFTKTHSKFQPLRDIANSRIRRGEASVERFPEVGKKKSEVSVTSPIHFLISVKCLPLEGKKNNWALWSDLGSELQKVPLIENHCKRNRNAYACSVMGCHWTSCSSTVIGEEKAIAACISFISLFSAHSLPSSSAID